MNYQREIERKFIVHGLSYDQASHILDSLFFLELWSFQDQTSFDQYWTAPGVDFVRLRENSQELTVKVTDKGTVIDRIEENVEVHSTEVCARFLNLLLGKPVMKLTKHFSVLRTETRLGAAIICLYQVAEDTEERVFLEVEAVDLDTVDKVLSKITPLIDLAPENRSLFQIFYKGENK